MCIEREPRPKTQASGEKKKEKRSQASRGKATEGVRTRREPSFLVRASGVVTSHPKKPRGRRSVTVVVTVVPGVLLVQVGKTYTSNLLLPQPNQLATISLAQSIDYHDVVKSCQLTNCIVGSMEFWVPLLEEGCCWACCRMAAGVNCCMPPIPIPIPPGGFQPWWPGGL